MHVYVISPNTLNKNYLKELCFSYRQYPIEHDQSTGIHVLCRVKNKLEAFLEELDKLNTDSYSVVESH